MRGEGAVGLLTGKGWSTVLSCLPRPCQSPPVPSRLHLLLLTCPVVSYLQPFVYEVPASQNAFRKASCPLIPHNLAEL